MTDRTVAGLPDSGKLHPYHHRAGDDDLVVDVVRPGDLVALTVTARGARLEPPPDPAAEHAHSTLVAGPEATLVVDLPFQHAHEEASYEAGKGPRPDPEDPEHPQQPPGGTETKVAARAPARYRPARGSRLVFTLGEGERVDWSTEGILRTLPRLDAVLHPRGEAPGRRPPRYELPGTGTFTLPPFEVSLPGGLVAVLRADDVRITRRASAGTDVPDPSNVAGRAALARNDALVARYAASRRVTFGRGIDSGALAGRVRDVVDLRGPGIVLRRGTFSRKATLDETAIEAPFRVQVSPTRDGHWVHAPTPVTAADAPGHVELWHTRLDTGARTEDDLLRPGTDADADTRVVRTVWARDRDDVPAPTWKDAAADKAGGALSPDVVTSGGVTADPFLGSLDRADRHRLVRQTAEVWPGTGRTSIQPVPVGAEKLWLTALGSWLELHGQWDTQPYSKALLASILAWDHIATGGRDQYVRVVYPGYLYPLGQPTVRVKITERSIRPLGAPVAGLFQRQFLAVIDPVRDHAVHGLPYTRTVISPVVTPPLDPPGDDVLPGLGDDEAFWPRVGGQAFRFQVDALDRDGRPASHPIPLLWVAESVGGAAKLKALDDGYRQSTRRIVDLGGQHVAFVPKEQSGDARLETRAMRLLGTARQGGSTPRLSTADVVLPAAQAIAGTGSTRITYYAPYRASGFTGSNPGRVWAASVDAGVAGDPAYAEDLVRTTDPGSAPDAPQAQPRIGFGGQPGDVGSDNAGGFAQPNLTVAGLSLRQGPVGDLASVAGDTFDAGAFLGAALPKLFGLVELADLIPGGLGLDKAPAMVTEALDTFHAVAAEVERARAIAEDAVAQAEAVRDRVQAAGGAALAEAEQLRTDAQALVTAFADLADLVADVFTDLAGFDAAAVEAALDAPAGLKARLTAASTATRALARAPLPLFARTRLTQVADALARFAASTDLVADVVAFLRLLDPQRKEVTFRYEWAPELRSWPQAPAAPLVVLQKDSFVLAVAGTIRASGPPSVEVLAELRTFELHLFGDDPLVTIPFERLAFHGGTSGKSEVDVVMDDIRFGGFLGFVETIKDLIPLDGFSDPPSVEVTPAGLTAGFSLTLPNLAIGVFSLSNMSLGADLRVPFLGETITFGFTFCTRERPFVLSVVFLGGGGWFLVRLSPKGLEVLELGLEAGAYLSVDFGVASGSISAAVGIYIRLEGEKGSLTGYFRLRGEVDVLGLISASIELYMELVYDFDTGKMVGRARITVEVDVLCFSASVSIEAERQLAGSNGDPTLREVVLEPDGTAPAWDDYLLAFAPEEVPA